jgi:hypothetical protein
MVTKILLGFATSGIFLVTSLQSATENAVKLLDAAITQSDKTKVQQLLANIDFTGDELLTAYTKALTIYDEKNTWCGQAAETLLSPTRSAALVLAGISFKDMLNNMKESSKLNKQVADGEMAYKKQAKTLQEEQDIRLKGIQQPYWSSFNAKYIAECEKNQKRIAELKSINDHKSMARPSVIRRAPQYSSRAKRAFALAVASTAVGVYLSQKRSYLKAARTILAMLEVKCVQKNVQFPVKTI